MPRRTAAALPLRVPETGANRAVTLARRAGITAVECRTPALLTPALLTQVPMLVARTGAVAHTAVVHTAAAPTAAVRMAADMDIVKQAPSIDSPHLHAPGGLDNEASRFLLPTVFSLGFLDRGSCSNSECFYPKQVRILVARDSEFPRSSKSAQGSYTRGN
jgi:hypothetical protein